MTKEWSYQSTGRQSCKVNRRSHECSANVASGRNGRLGWTGEKAGNVLRPCASGVSLSVQIKSR